MASIVELPDAVGNIVSPALKIGVVCLLSFIAVLMVRKYTARKHVAPLAFGIMIALYAAATLFSAFNTLLGWETAFATEGKTFLGMGIAFILQGQGNAVYFWLTLVLFHAGMNASTRRLSVIVVVIVELVATILHLVFRLLQDPLHVVFSAIHSLASAIIFAFNARAAFSATRKAGTPEIKRRFSFIFKASTLGIGMIVLFLVDSFYDGVTVFSIAGWLLLVGVAACLYKGYV